MKWTKTAFIILASAALCAVPGQAGPGDLLLLDAPRGAWLASLRSDAPVTVLEERDGWRRVRVEGWIAPDSSSPRNRSESDAAGVKTAPAAPAPRPAAAAAVDAAAGGAIRGVLAPIAGSAAGPGANAVVLLLGGIEALDEAHSRTGADCRQKVAAASARVDALRAESQRVLNSTDNFREASSRSDAIKKEAQAAESERRTIVQDCRRAADALFDLHAVQRTIADGAGRFEFKGVPPGTYRVVATAAGDPSPRAWSFDCRVAEATAVTLDAVADASRVGPYWDLR